MIIHKTYEIQIEANQIIDYIQNNLYVRNPSKGGNHRVKLMDCQKMLIKQILSGNRMVVQSRQVGNTTVFVLVMQAIAKLRPQIDCTLVVSNYQQVKNIKYICNTNQIYINVKTVKNIIDTMKQSMIQYIDSNLTIFDITIMTNDVNTMLLTLDKTLFGTNYITININVESHIEDASRESIWKQTLLYNTKFTPIYMPFYIAQYTSQLKIEEPAGIPITGLNYTAKNPIFQGAFDALLKLHVELRKMGINLEQQQQYFFVPEQNTFETVVFGAASYDALSHIGIKISEDNGLIFVDTVGSKPFRYNECFNCISEQLEQLIEKLIHKNVDVWLDIIPPDGVFLV